MAVRSKQNTKAGVFNPGQELSISRVSALREDIIGLLSEGKDLELDLCDVKECDTAGVQLIISIIKYAGSGKQKVTVKNATEPFYNEVSDLGFCPEELTI